MEFTLVNGSVPFHIWHDVSSRVLGIFIDMMEMPFEGRLGLCGKGWGSLETHDSWGGDWKYLGFFNLEEMGLDALMSPSPN